MKKRLVDDNMLIIYSREFNYNANSFQLSLKFYINNFKKANAENEFIKNK